jgi:hypothetical protein
MAPSSRQSGGSIPISKERTMKNLAGYAVRTLALIAATGVTALTLFVHGVDRAQLGAPDVPYVTAAHTAPDHPAVVVYAPIARADTASAAQN